MHDGLKAPVLSGYPDRSSRVEFEVRSRRCVKLLAGPLCDGGLLAFYVEISMELVLSARGPCIAV